MNQNEIVRLAAEGIAANTEGPLFTAAKSGQLPDKSNILKAVGLLRQLLFTGYFDPPCGKAKNEVLLWEILGLIERETAKAFLSSGKTGNAEEVAAAFIERLPEIQGMLLKDVDAMFEGDPAAASREEIIFSYPGMTAIASYRIAHELYLLGVPYIPRIITEDAHSSTGIDINPGATIGEYFFIDHGTGIVIGETTVIGSHVKLYQGVTLGALSLKEGRSLSDVKRHPTIEDGVTVYANATILGGNTVIGEGAVIGGNCFITSSVPGGTRVILGATPQEYR